jgi:cytochrome P450
MSDQMEDVDQVQVAFNPFADGYFDDPYQQYALLREHAPVHESPMGLVMCFAYDDIRQLLLETRTSMQMANAASVDARAQAGDVDQAPASLALLGRDPPDHTRLRRLMSKSFTPRRIEALSTWIQTEVERLVDDLERRWRDERVPIDIIDHYAFPLPFSVISRMLGMPDGDELLLRTWAHDVTEAMDPMVTPEQAALAATAMKGMTDYITDEVMPWKASHLDDDLLSSLIAARAEGTIVSDAELVDQVTLLYMAGHETTVGLIGNGLHTLHRHRAQLERLRNDPSLMSNAVDELNRFDGPIQFGWRIAADELTIRDTTISTGQMVFLCLGSANRDQSHFGPDADQLDITRPNAGELLSYGGGMHFCLGAALARRETTLAIGELLRRFPAMEVTSTPSWNPQITFRKFSQLMVTLD